MGDLNLRYCLNRDFLPDVEELEPVFLGHLVQIRGRYILLR